MIYKNLLYTGMLFVVLPVWFGLLWVWYLKIEGTVRKLCNAWVLGLASMFASGQILLVPMILGKRTLHRGCHTLEDISGDCFHCYHGNSDTQMWYLSYSRK